MSKFLGDGGDNNFTGSVDSDVFNFLDGGNDTASGLAGNDHFLIGGTLTAADQLDGGADYDNVNLSGDYTLTNAVIFGATTVTNIELLRLADSAGYDLTTDDATVAAGATLAVYGSTLTAGHSLDFDGSAELDGHFKLVGGAGNDILIGGDQRDTFSLQHGGIDSVAGGDGDDRFSFGGAYTTADEVDGNGGKDRVTLSGDYAGANALVLTVTFSGIETLRLVGGNDYDITTINANVAGGGTLTVEAGGLGAGDSLTLNAGAETDGRMTIIAGAGDDDIVGAFVGSTILLGKGGVDSALGGGFNDTFKMGASLTAADSVDGFEGTDTVTLAGDYSAGLTFGATTILNIDQITLLGTHSYNLTTDEATLASGKVLIVDGHSLKAGNSITLDTTAETDGTFDFRGGAGDDQITVERQGVFFGIKINGGAGSDTVILQGSYSDPTNFGATTMLGVETLKLTAGDSYNLITNDATISGGSTLTIDGNTLGAGDFVHVAGGAETTGHFNFIGGAGNDQLTGGSRSDTFDLTKGGDDVVRGGGGADTFNASGAAADFQQFVYFAASDSTGPNYDTINDINFDSDLIDISGFATLPSVMDAAVTTGTLSTATFNADMKAAIGAGQLGANETLLFTADAGNLSGHTFLVVDVDGIAGYRGNHDLVIDVTGFSGTFSTSVLS